MAELSREHFAQQVIEIVRSRFPLVKLARSDLAFTLKFNGHVAPLENLYRIALLRPERMQHDVEQWAVELLRASEGSPDQGAPLEQVKDRILPMVLSSRAADPKTMAQQTLVDGLCVCYALDSDRTISYVPPSALEAWNVSVDDLHELAINNLIARSQEIAAHAAPDPSGQITLILFQTGDGFDASRLLLPTLHDRLREYLGSPFAAGIPNRDILLCFRNDKETIERLQDQIADDYKRMPHQVTDKLLLITADGIAPWSG